MALDLRRPMSGICSPKPRILSDRILGCRGVRRAGRVSCGGIGDGDGGGGPFLDMVVVVMGGGGDGGRDGAQSALTMTRASTDRSRGQSQ